MRLLPAGFPVSHATQGLGRFLQRQAVSPRCLHPTSPLATSFGPRTLRHTLDKRTARSLALSSSNVNLHATSAASSPYLTRLRHQAQNSFAVQVRITMLRIERHITRLLPDTPDSKKNTRKPQQSDQSPEQETSTDLAPQFSSDSPRSSTTSAPRLSPAPDPSGAGEGSPPSRDSEEQIHSAEFIRGQQFRMVWYSDFALPSRCRFANSAFGVSPMMQSTQLL